MNLIGLALVLVLLAGLLIDCDLYRIRKDCQRMRADIEAEKAEAAFLYEKAREVYADAAARWSSIVTLEGRIH